MLLLLNRRSSLGPAGVERQAENEVAPGFPVRIEVERCIHSPLQRLAHDQIDPVQVLDGVTCHRSAHEARKLPLDPLRRDAALEQFEILRVIDPDIHVRRVAFIAGTGMRELAHAQVINSSYVGLTKRQSIKTEFLSPSTVRTPP